MCSTRPRTRYTVVVPFPVAKITENFPLNSFLHFHIIVYGGSGTVFITQLCWLIRFRQTAVVSWNLFSMYLIYVYMIYLYTLLPDSHKLQCVAVCCSVLQCVAVCCSVLQCVAMCCNVLQCVAVCCSVLQCVAVCCSVLQCVAVNGKTPFPGLHTSFCCTAWVERCSVLAKIVESRVRSDSHLRDSIEV